jgi:hypothetical protein
MCLGLHLPRVRIKNIDTAELTVFYSHTYIFDTIPTQLPRLVSLELTETETSQSIHTILDSLTLPALRDLCIHSSRLPHGIICSLFDAVFVFAYATSASL